MRRATLGVCLVAILQTCGMLAAVEVARDSVAYADHATPRAVSLADARRAPDFMALLYPARDGRVFGGDDTYRPTGYHMARAVRVCGGRAMYSDVSAYTWRGRALGPQRYDHVEGMRYWRGRGGRVGLEGRTWYNGTRTAVLVAAWCG